MQAEQEKVYRQKLIKNRSVSRAKISIITEHLVRRSTGHADILTREFVEDYFKSNIMYRILMLNEAVTGISEYYVCNRLMFELSEYEISDDTKTRISVEVFRKMVDDICDLIYSKGIYPSEAVNHIYALC